MLAPGSSHIIGSQVGEIPRQRNRKRQASAATGGVPAASAFSPSACNHSLLQVCTVPGACHRAGSRRFMLALRRRLLLHVLLLTARGAPPSTTFHATNGSYLYRGCAPPSHARDASRHLFLPDYIVIGAQKGGTETLSYELGALSLDGRRLCHARAEVHFFGYFCHRLPLKFSAIMVQNFDGNLVRE